MAGALALYAAAPALGQRLAWPGAVRTGALTAALALGMLLLARWSLSGPALIRLIVARRASNRDVHRLLAAYRPPAGGEPALEEAT
jgi:hypothetical protein